MARAIADRSAGVSIGLTVGAWIIVPILVAIALAT